MEKYFDSCHSQLLVMLEALSESLSLPVDYFSHMHSRREHELRLLHYPEVSISELRSGSKIRISEHTDFGSISLLFQDDVGGLEIEDQTEPGLFHPLECEPGVMIVNLGDSLQRWTNDALKSVNHRVTIPRTLQDTKEGIIAERYSIAFFGKPNRDVSVAALPQFVSDGMPSRYQQMTAGEYNQAKLLRTY
jgi:isopenicillin N synthase-like dioxygenase